MADEAPAVGRAVKGVLVRQGLQDSIMAPEDLPVFTKLRPGRILQRQALLLAQPFVQVGRPRWSTCHLGMLGPGCRLCIALQRPVSGACCRAGARLDRTLLLVLNRHAG